MILSIAVLVQCRLPIDRQTNGQTNGATDGRTYDDSINGARVLSHGDKTTPRVGRLAVVRRVPGDPYRQHGACVTGRTSLGVFLDSASLIRDNERRLSSRDVYF